MESKDLGGPKPEDEKDSFLDLKKEIQKLADDKLQYNYIDLWNELWDQLNINEANNKLIISKDCLIEKLKSYIIALNKIKKLKHAEMTILKQELRISEGLAIKKISKDKWLLLKLFFNL